jgi:hypothetical protein
VHEGFVVLEELVEHREEGGTSMPKCVVRDVENPQVIAIADKRFKNAACSRPFDLVPVEVELL